MGPLRRPRQGRGEAPAPGRGERWIYGRHTVAAALANPARRWRRLAVLAGQEAEAAALAAAAMAARRGAGEPLRVVDRAALAALLPPGAVHQGLALEAEPLAAPDLDAVLDEAGETAIAVVLDRVTDPHNVGAVLRSAAAFGAVAVIVPEHGAPPVGGVLAKAASGALETVALVRAVNLARALDRLKEAGFWVCGLDAAAPATLAALDLGARAALVLGSEGGGLRRLVRQRCDHLARLPTCAGQTLNVSNAAAVALYELVRGREAT
jgi:23S rRNA (guanosine2251-2'-O)-methyltransferase